ncbi:ComEC/Rec2 family competence protein [Pedobacter sp. KR3-3]|uniref:ComEC/Rec2 family competence protein n=1 Tax=Pedobacter albus TaxID=3113905 RepID=A0ABU7I3T6_9SPHI|nr:ComEC/Rec2 family competence protein [Pedobacter sp. KR3-3]MEE1944110.1 ComEC/Rec2 family competence protein [Pedobacter sp. KR3-3]
MTFKGEIVFVRVLFPFLAGLVLGYHLPDWFPSYLIVASTIGLLIALWLTNLFYKKWKIYHYKGITGLLFYVFCCCFGTSALLLNEQSLSRHYFGKYSATYLKGYISNEPQTNGLIMRFQVTVGQGYQQNSWQPRNGKLLVALKLDKIKPIKLNYGDKVLLFSQHQEVEPPYNPAEFDFKAWLAHQNIYHQVFINQNQLVQLRSQGGNPVLKYAITLRQKQVAIYRKLIHNDEAFAVASTLILGYRADLSPETLDAYSKTGTIHALSVSGMHVGIIYIFLNWVLFFLDRKPILKIVKLLLICTLIWYYALLTGLSPSVLRSAVMLSVYIIAKSLNRSTNSYNIIAFTAFGLLVYDPLLLWDVGFELSFLAVFGLIYLQPKIYKWFYVKNKWLDKLWSATAISLAAQLATFPLSIYYFHQFPLYFIISNLFILLPITVLMYLGIIILILRLYFLAPLFEWLINFTNHGLQWIARLPFAGINGIWIDQWQLILLSFALGSLIIALTRYQKQGLFAGLGLVIVLQSTLVYRYIQASQQQKTIGFSLRKNYAMAFVKGKNAVVVSDLATNDKAFKFYVRPALEQLQINRFTFLNFNQDTATKYLAKKEHQLQFGHYKLLLLDSSLNSKKIGQLPKFDLVWIHRGFNRKLVELRQELVFSELIIDASLKDYQIRRYVAEANKIGISVHILKKNNSYLIDF